MKTCNKCKIEKSLDSFNKEKLGVLGLRSDCKSCRKEYRDSRKDITKLYHQAYYKEHKEEYHERTKKHRSNNRESVNKQASDRLKLNRVKANEAKKKYYHKMKNDPIYNLIYRIRNRTKNAIATKGFRKDFKYPDYIGCSKEELKVHIEKQFTDGMTWDRLLSREIHIDHILPIGKAKTAEEVFKLSHYTNLQPMWAMDNLKKGAR